MPADVVKMVEAVNRQKGIILAGIGTNLACFGGIEPDKANIEQLSALAAEIEAKFKMKLEFVSGGNSANLNWALSVGDGAEDGEHDIGRINNLRLGESILLGCEPLHRQPIEGLHTDAITLVAEVIESKVKPAQPWGKIGQNAFGENPTPTTDKGHITQAILAIGQQDIDPQGLQAPTGIKILGASSDHLIINSGQCYQPVGSEVRFQLNYSAMVRAMTSPYVEKLMVERSSEGCGEEMGVGVSF